PPRRSPGSRAGVSLLARLLRTGRPGCATSTGWRPPRSTPSLTPTPGPRRCRARLPPRRAAHVPDHGPGAAAALGAVVPRRSRRSRDPVGTAGGVRLAAVPRAAPVLAGARRETRHGERRRDVLPDPVRGT